MWAVRAIILILVAATLGSAASAFAFLVPLGGWREFNVFFIVGLIYSLVGTSLVVTIQHTLVSQGWSGWTLSLSTILAGAVLGPVLVILTLPPGMFTILLGLLFGTVCAATWVILDILAPC